MSWKTASLNWPQAIEQIKSQTTASLQAATSQCDERLGKLSRLSRLPLNKSPTASSATSAQSIKQKINQLMANASFIGVTHPWQQTVGQGELHQRALSAPNALLALCSLLKNSNHLMTSAADSITLLFTANSIQSLHDKLAPFNAAFPIPELVFVQRKTRQLLSLERDKLVISNNKSPSNLKPRLVNQFETVHNMARSLKQLNANMSAMDLENTAPITELNQVIERKQKMLKARETHYQHLKNALSGGDFYSHFSSGNRLFDIAQSLESSHYPGHEWTHSVGVIFIAQSGELNLLKEIFSL